MIIFVQSCQSYVNVSEIYVLLDQSFLYKTWSNLCHSQRCKLERTTTTTTTTTTTIAAAVAVTGTTTTHLFMGND